ncbi:MAG: peptidase [Desulfitobacteriaceae bacterium]
MKRNKWTLEMVLAGALVLSGGAIALASGANFSLGQSLTPTLQTVVSENKGANLGTQVSVSEQKSETTQAGPAAADSTQAAQNGVPGANVSTISSTPNSSSPNSSIGGPYGFGGGYGMMGGFTGSNGLGYGTGYGMMGGGYNAQSLGVNLSNGQVATAEQAEALAKAYLQKVSPDLAVDELHEFADSFEVEAKDASTGAKAYEFVISKNGGYIYAEMGPNLMWNTKYGHMNWGNSGAPTVSADQATQTAQDFVQKLGQEYSLEGPETAPGYYEFMVLKDGKDYAELNVNGYSGQVWFETWHGPIVSTVEVK